MDEQNIANDTNSKMFNRSAVTLAYIIDTAQFEADYGFPFPTINGRFERWNDNAFSGVRLPQRGGI